MYENIPRNLNCQRQPDFSMDATLAGGGYHNFEVTLLHTSMYTIKGESFIKSCYRLHHMNQVSAPPTPGPDTVSGKM